MNEPGTGTGIVLSFPAGVSLYVFLLFSQKHIAPRSFHWYFGKWTWRQLRYGWNAAVNFSFSNLQNPDQTAGLAQMSGTSNEKCHKIPCLIVLKDNVPYALSNMLDFGFSLSADLLLACIFCLDVWLSMNIMYQLWMARLSCPSFLSWWNPLTARGLAVGLASNHAAYSCWQCKMMLCTEWSQTCSKCCIWSIVVLVWECEEEGMHASMALYYWY